MFFTKKKVLLISFFAFIVDVVLIKFSQVHTDLCSLNITYPPIPIFDCFEALILYLLVISIPVFFISLLIYKIKENIFLSWRKFTFIYLFIYLFIIIISPWEGDVFSSFTKGLNSLILSLLYTFLSVINIGYQYTQKKHPLLYFTSLSIVSIIIIIIIIDVLL